MCQSCFCWRLFPFSLTDIDWKTHLAYNKIYIFQRVKESKSKHHKLTNYLLTYLKKFLKNFQSYIFNWLESKKSKSLYHKNKRGTGSRIIILCSRKYIMLQYLEKKYIENMVSLWIPKIKDFWNIHTSEPDFVIGLLEVTAYQRKMIYIEITSHLVIIGFLRLLKIALFQEFREHCVKYKNAILSWHGKKRAQNEGC